MNLSSLCLRTVTDWARETAKTNCSIAAISLRHEHLLSLISCPVPPSLRRIIDIFLAFIMMSKKQPKKRLTNYNYVLSD